MRPMAPRRVRLDETDLRQWFEGSFGRDALRTVVRTIETDENHDGGVRICGDVLDPVSSRVIGDFQRRIYFTASGELEVFSHGLEIEPHYRRRGFAAEFGRHLEQIYRRNGVRRIRLTAGRGAGGRAWARAYDFDDDRLRGFGGPESPGAAAGVGAGGEHVVLPMEGSAHDLRAALVRAIFDAARDDGRITEGERSQLEPLVPHLTVPARIAALPRGVGDDILRGARWPGVRILD
jgi:GNAT superfamily N-acetyltransferase